MLRFSPPKRLRAVVRTVHEAPRGGRRTPDRATVVLTWRDPDTLADGSAPVVPLARVELYRSNGSGFENIGEVAPTVETFIDTVPTPGANLYYAAAVDAQHWMSGRSNVATVTV